MAREEISLSRRERRRLEIRERILETARTVFETNGYESTTINDIASQADIAYGTFFNHFPTKLDLLRELSDRTIGELVENIEEVRKEPGSFSEHFIRIFDHTALSAEEMGPKARDLVGAMVSLAYPETAESDDRRMRMMFQRLIEDGLAAGAVRSDEELETLIEVVVGTWYSLFMSWVHLDDYPLRERAGRAGRFLARTLEPPLVPTGRDS